MPVEYQAPLRDLRFVVEELTASEAVAALPGFEEFSPDLSAAVLEEAGKFATGVLSPLNWPGDQHGAQRQPDASVKTAPGFDKAYSAFVEGGWNSLSCNPDFGGQGLPQLLATAVNEMWNASNMSFALCPMLTAGAIHAIQAHGTQAQKDLYLPKMVSGEWTGTMNLTEPQAGSDLAAVVTKAWPLNKPGPSGEASYCVHGTKIYITYGEHDLTENIIHLVLARLPDAPAGVKGISLFIVPKFLVNADGSLGARNDLQCVSLEHKLGIHASPTAVMSYGEKEGAVGYLVGEPHRGLEYMFTMMNDARLQVGVQGVSISERAYQQAHWYAHDRVQGRVMGQSEPRPIAYHPDVRRILATMKCRIEAMRALACEAAAELDQAARHPDSAQARLHQARADLLIPVVKAWCTESGVEMASLGIQVHGGMGFIEETGAAQHLRDARITTIYEGTTAIQANDFIGRKLGRDKGAEAMRLLAEVKANSDALRACGHPDAAGLADALAKSVAVLSEALEATLEMSVQNPVGSFFGSVPLLMLTGSVLGGWMMARSALIAQAKTAVEPFYAQKLASAVFYGQSVLLPSLGLVHAVRAGAAGYAQAESFTGQ
jgi:alkylation response protein AidB-like acyl-CoA dehydrogenase